jgi:carbon monoxide dehydrogenase subunit G
MDFQGRYLIPAPPEAVWAALHDPDILASCIPGSQSVMRISETDYQAVAVIKIGPVKARFSGKVNWLDAEPTEGFTHVGVLSGEGKGGPAGFAKGQSQVQLAVEGENTVLTYSAKATVGGKLAQIGQRLIDATAKSIADNFFASFEKLMRAGGKAAEGNAPATIPTDTAKKKLPVEEGLKPQIWVVGLIATVVLLLILFGIAL